MSKKLFSILALATSISAFAQNDSSKNNLDEVVISATKFSTKTSATGKVVTIVTKDQLEKSGGKDLSQILTEQTGIVINGANSNAGKDKNLYLRGAAAEYTLITIDGVPMYDASGVGANFDIRNISVDLVERIEILKGSQSTLYGSDAVAGVINIITKKGSNNKKINLTGLVSYGTYNNQKATIGINGKLDKNLDYNVGYSYNKLDGISEAVTTDSLADKDGFKQESFNANVSYRINNNISIKPFLRYNWIKASTDFDAFLNDNDNGYTQKNYSVGVRNEFNFKKVKVNLIYSLTKTERNYLNDSFSVNAAQFDYFSKSQFNAADHFVDLYIKFDISKSFNLIVGADYRASTIDNNSIGINAFGKTTSLLKPDSIKHNQLGFYTAINYTNNKDISAEFGVRMNNHNVFGNNVVFNFNPVYTPNDDVKMFANVSTGYRTPSLFQIYGDGNYTSTNTNIKPETSVNIELGLTHLFDNKKFKTEFVAFSRSIKNILFYQFNPTTFTGKYINQDEQFDLGFEADVQYQMCKGFIAKASYTYVEGLRKSKDANGFEVVDYQNALLRRPTNTFALNLAYHINEKLFVSSHLQYFDERKDSYYNYTTFNRIPVTNASYALIDVYAEYKAHKNLTAFVNVRNIADAKYTETVGYNTLGRTINGGVRFNF